MDELIKLLHEDLEYISHEIIKDTIYITVTSIKTELICPHCGCPSSRVHSRYERRFQDLPIQGKKVVIILKNKKIFCDNEKCNATTFAEKFTFLNNKAKRTIRLEDEILRISSNCSSISASQLLSASTATIGKSTICSLLKKRRTYI